MVRELQPRTVDHQPRLDTGIAAALLGDRQTLVLDDADIDLIPVCPSLIKQ